MTQVSVLIGLHQLIKNNIDNTNQRHWGTGNLMSTKNRTKNNNPQHSAFLTKWLNKLASLLSKGVRNLFSAWVIEACRRRLTSKGKRHQLKVMKNEHPVLPSEQDIRLNSLNYGHCSNWVAVLPLFHSSDRLRVGSVLNSIKFEWSAWLWWSSQPPK